jgi:hypothetical protein
LLLPGRERVKVIFRCSHQSSRWWLMNSDPLSESTPMTGNGMTFAISSSAAMTQRRALFLTERFSVQPVAMSVTVSV